MELQNTLIADLHEDPRSKSAAAQGHAGPRRKGPRNKLVDFPLNHLMCSVGPTRAVHAETRGRVRRGCSTPMVEAAGVEPASEIAVSRETPCVVAFQRLRNVRLERTRCARH
jgi:hypothetical protein